MQLVTLPDLVGNNAVHRVTDLMTAAGVAVPTPPNARTVLVRELTGGTTGSRVGDANVSAARGVTLSASDSLLLPAIAIGAGLQACFWDLSALYIYAATGDTLNIALVL
jgi:hypothetical protein